MKKVLKQLTLILVMSLAAVSRAQITELGRLYATIDIGKYIEIKDAGPIKLYQDESSADPFHTYEGCRDTVVECNFNAAMRGTAKATSPAQGKWTVSIDPEIVPSGTTTVSICIMGTEVQTQYLQGGQSDVPVAEVVIEVISIGS